MKITKKQLMARMILDAIRRGDALALQSLSVQSYANGWTDLGENAQFIADAMLSDDVLSIAKNKFKPENDGAE